MTRLELRSDQAERCTSASIQLLCSAKLPSRLCHSVTEEKMIGVKLGMKFLTRIQCSEEGVASLVVVCHVIDLDVDCLLSSEWTVRDEESMAD